MSGHTPEPWISATDYKDERPMIWDGENQMVIADFEHLHSKATGLANRDRAILCVNACTGMVAPALEIEVLRDTSRHFSNIQQDLCEGALVPVSLFDAVCQALAEVKPDHPALKQAAPSYGTWAALRMENERLQEAVRVLVDALAGRMSDTEHQPRVLEWLAPDAVRNNPIAWAAVQEWIASRPAE
jgi:hypothetical protein